MGDLFIDCEYLPSFTAFTRVVAHATVENVGPECTNDSTGVGEWVFFNHGKNKAKESATSKNKAKEFERKKELSSQTIKPSMTWNE